MNNGVVMIVIEKEYVIDQPIQWILLHVHVVLV